MRSAAATATLSLRSSSSFSSSITPSLRGENKQTQNHGNMVAFVVFISKAVPKGGASKLLFLSSQEVLEVLDLSLQQSILVLTLVDEVLQTLGHVQLPLSHLLYPQTKLGELLRMLVGGLKLP